MAKRILPVLLISVLFISGCGSSSLLSQINPINPPSVHAAAGLPVSCNADGTCSLTTQTTWGYCQYETHQNGRTFSVKYEIGFSSTPTDPNTSLCFAPFALGGGTISSITGGNSNYVPRAAYGKPAALASVSLDVRTCTAIPCDWPTKQEFLIEHKFTAFSDPVTIPISQINYGATGMPMAGIMFVFNDDLNVKPTTVSMSFTGTFE